MDYTDLLLLCPAEGGPVHALGAKLAYEEIVDRPRLGRQGGTRTRGRDWPLAEHFHFDGSSLKRCSTGKACLECAKAKQWRWQVPNVRRTGYPSLSSRMSGASSLPGWPEPSVRLISATPSISNSMSRNCTGSRRASQIFVLPSRLFSILRSRNSCLSRSCCTKLILS